MTQRVSTWPVPRAGYTEAERTLSHALQLLTTIFGATPHAKLAEVHNQLGDVQRKLSEFTLSLDSCRTALEMFLAVFGPQHPDVAECRMRIGLNYLKLEKDVEEALIMFKTALVVLTATLGDSHEKVATCHTYLGDAYRKEGDLLRARDHYCTALRINTEVHGAVHVEVAESHYKLGRLFKKLHWYNDDGP